ncbi:MAG: DUF2452 domain-containing protein [Pseudomonadota bacterium]
MPDNPNPQGKAALPLLADLQSWRGTAAPARNARDVLVDYLSGLLVLSADFNFRPVPGKPYHLYFRDGQWQLSLVAPGEWRPPRWGAFAAYCELGLDATWTVEPAGDLSEKPELVMALRQFRAGFEARLAAAETVEGDLPHFEAHLPYYRRVMASGLASSLQYSLKRLGLANASGRALLAHQEDGPS